jgi:thiol-disulfide isomerase/thioredoxin
MKSARRLLLVALLAATSVADAAVPVRSIEFHRSIEEARKAAKAERPAVILFGASWCAWCRKMDVDTLADPKVTTIAGQFLWVKVDVDKDQELATRFGWRPGSALRVFRLRSSSTNRGASWARRADTCRPTSLSIFC